MTVAPHMQELPKPRLLAISLGTGLAMVLAFWATMHHHEMHLLQPNMPEHYTYCDSLDQGTSTSKIWTEQGQLVFAYKLGSGFQYPYAGLGLNLIDDSLARQGRFLNLDQFDSVTIRLRSTRSDRLRMQIITHDPSLTREDKPLSHRYLVQSIPVTPSWNEVRLSLDEFAIPEWWFDANHLRPEPSDKFLNRALKLEIQNGLGMLLGFGDTVEIATIKFHGQRNWVHWLALLAALGLLAMGAALAWLHATRERMEAETQRIVRKGEWMSQYGKLEVTSHRTREAQTVLDAIHAKYHEAELSLEDLCRETGINRNKLTEILKQEVGATFKTYLNELRLTEASRLLCTSDLQVTEVAYKVGFGNVSHFNRVFKEKFNVPPLEHRRNQGAPHESKPGMDT